MARLLSSAEWRDAAARHLARVSPWTTAFRQRRSLGHTHPVHDFLFTYYSFRPSHLEEWHPGLGVTLTGAGSESFLEDRRYSQDMEGVSLDPSRMTAVEKKRTAWIRNLLAAIVERPPQFGCFGLHEWAMVYPTPETRYEDIRLRMSPGDLAAFIDGQKICCSHFDAFRFFTPAARPRNSLQPTRETLPNLEQAGCLHTNLDLYKWSYKLAPWTGSDLIADAFELACDAREIDMRASPYDLESLGFSPIRIETPAGRAEYEKEQRAITARSIPIRHRLLDLCTSLTASASQPPPLAAAVS